MSSYRYPMAGSRINYDPRPDTPPEWEAPDAPEEPDPEQVAAERREAIIRAGSMGARLAGYLLTWAAMSIRLSVARAVALRINAFTANGFAVDPREVY